MGSLKTTIHQKLVVSYWVPRKSWPAAPYKLDEFAFELVDEDGTDPQTKANDATGQIYFDALAYEKAGEYRYTIREQAETMAPSPTNKRTCSSRDRHRWSWTVTAVAEYEGNQVFENSYQPKAVVSF